MNGCSMRSGKLAFDIGAHIGDMTADLLEKGYNVIAVEPNPHLADHLRNRFSGDRRVEVVEAAVGETGREIATLTIPANRDGWGLATLLTDRRGTRFEGWFGWGGEKHYTVSVVTLDELMQRYGTPEHIKIDVEGYEQQVLLGLRQKVNTIRYEWMAEEVEKALVCARIIEQFGECRYEIMIGAGSAIYPCQNLEELKFRLREAIQTHAEAWGDILAYLK